MVTRIKCFICNCKGHILITSNILAKAEDDVQRPCPQCNGRGYLSVIKYPYDHDRFNNKHLVL